ncbi:hypothetical protein NIES2107_06460 [Nostoc carneum NIES-2107]|nr:hypothetical protein NIES2107_06460 [Nostoc carneum NIES-2107]
MIVFFLLCLLCLPKRLIIFLEVPKYDTSYVSCANNVSWAKESAKAMACSEV